MHPRRGSQRPPGATQPSEGGRAAGRRAGRPSQPSEDRRVRADPA